MSALTVVETDLDCEGGKEEMSVQSQFPFPLHSHKKKQKNLRSKIKSNRKSNRIESNRIESNRHPGWNEVVRSRTLDDDPTRSVDTADDADADARANG